MTTLVRCCMCSFFMLIYWCNTVSSQVVNIPDPNLETAIREALELPDQTPITPQEMLRLTRLGASKRQIKDLTGLEHATNLTGLSLHQNSINNLRSLAGLTHLKGLSLWGNPISDLSPLANLTELTGLDLGACQISDIAPLAGLTQLTELALSHNRIVDVNPLANLVNLIDLKIAAIRSETLVHSLDSTWRASILIFICCRNLPL